jgi:hypothetical protein
MGGQRGGQGIDLAIAALFGGAVPLGADAAADLTGSRLDKRADTMG